MGHFFQESRCLAKTVVPDLDPNYLKKVISRQHKHAILKSVKTLKLEGHHFLTFIVYLVV